MELVLPFSSASEACRLGALIMASTERFDEIDEARID
jgi:hypothetical protein